MLSIKRGICFGGILTLSDYILTIRKRKTYAENADFH